MNNIKRLFSLKMMKYIQHKQYMFPWTEPCGVFDSAIYEVSGSIGMSGFEKSMFFL
jgi:hypothetical protein